MRRKMCTVELKEFDNNQEKYIKLAEKEIIQITNCGKNLFTIDKKTLKEMKSFHELSMLYKKALNMSKNEKR